MCALAVSKEFGAPTGPELNGVIAVALVDRVGREHHEPAVDGERSQLDAETKEPLTHVDRRAT